VVDFWLEIYYIKYISKTTKRLTQMKQFEYNEVVWWETTLVSNGILLQAGIAVALVAVAIIWNHYNK